MSEWKKYTLADVTTVLGDGLHGTPKYQEDGPVYFINGNNLINGSISLKDATKRVSEEEARKYKKPLNDRTIMVSINGTIGNVAKYNGESCILGKSACYFNVKKEFDKDFIYYVVCNPSFVANINRLATGTTIKNVSLKTMREYSFLAPSLKTQQNISKILSSIDSKIAINRKINENLEQQAQALFHRWFVEFEFPNEQGLPYKSNGGAFIDSELGRIPNGWKVFHADEVFHINIGKTPPRKEQEWFSNESKNNIKWVSISDLGGIGVFVNDSKEYLSKDAISKFNIIVVPRNTVLLSFKLTVGRVAIANCKLTTNEAIARFYLPKEYFREYTYLALKNYNYSKLGSTSSIAIAVNSKIIKAMPILIPSDNILKLFNVVMAPVFNIIEKNQTTIENLVSLRDTLLPKLMNNEINL